MNIKKYGLLLLICLQAVQLCALSSNGILGGDLDSTRNTQSNSPSSSYSPRRSSSMQQQKQEQESDEQEKKHSPSFFNMIASQAVELPGKIVGATAMGLTAELFSTYVGKGLTAAWSIISGPRSEKSNYVMSNTSEIQGFSPFDLFRSQKREPIKPESTISFLQGKINGSLAENTHTVLTNTALQLAVPFLQMVAIQGLKTVIG
jgi:hypothetical protein